MQVKVTYRAEVTADPFGSFIVHFEDVPGALALGPDEEAAINAAPQALKAALESLLDKGAALPAPRALTGHDVSVVVEIRPVLRAERPSPGRDKAGDAAQPEQH